MFEHLNTPNELFSYKLGSALSMEHDSLRMLGTLEENATKPELKQLFREHAEETRHQISNLEQCFQLLGQDVTDAPNPTTNALAKEGQATMKKTAQNLINTVVLGAGLETEHYEIAVYETLAALAEANGKSDIARLLRENLGQEVEASEKIKQAAQHVADDIRGD